MLHLKLFFLPLYHMGKLFYYSVSKIFTLVVFLLGVNFCFAQTDPCERVIQGYVLDIETDEPLIGAAVLVQETGQGASTDLTGFFEITKVCEEETDLVISYLGYKTMKHHHDAHHSIVKVYLAADGTMLESIIVEAERMYSGISTGAIQRLTEDQMLLAIGESLGSKLTQIPGVTTIQNGQNLMSPVIHGLTGNRIVIMNQGVRHEYQSWDTDHAPEIDGDSYQTIEVIKGAASVRYGADALGGVILLEGKPIELSSPLSARVGLLGMVNGRAGGVQSQVRKGFKNGTVELQSNLYQQGDLNAPEYIMTNTGMSTVSHSLRTRFHLSSNLDLEASISDLRQKIGILRSSVVGNLDDLEIALKAESPSIQDDFSYEIAPPRQRIVHQMGRIALEYVDDHQAFKTQYSYQRNLREEYDVRRGNQLEIPNIDVQLESHIVDLDWTHPSWNHMDGHIGAQWKFNDNRNIPGTNTVSFIPNYISHTAGLYAIERYTKGQFVWELGARLDYQFSNIRGLDENNDLYSNQLQFFNTSGILGLAYQLNDHIQYTSNLSTAWRPPSIGELFRFGRRGSFIEYGLWRYQVDDGTLSTAVVQDQESKPIAAEQAFKWVHEISFQQEKWFVQATVHGSLINNYIYARPGGVSQTIRGAAPVFIYDQDDVWIWGADFQSSWNHHQQWLSDFSARYIQGHIRSSDSPIPMLAPAQVAYRLNYKADIPWFDKFNLSWNTEYTFQQWDHPPIVTVDQLIANDPDNPTNYSLTDPPFDILAAPEAYFLHDFSCLIQKDRWQVILQVQNVFNESYRSYTDRMRYFTDNIGRQINASIFYSI